MQALVPFAPDTWLLPCPRALDHSPPGDWTLRFRSDGSVVDVGCWLARNIVFERVTRPAPSAPG
jgi:D-aminopeptidase